jgi:capsular polysaccharide biosynthesis protein
MRCGAAAQRETWQADTITVFEQKCHQLNTDKGLAAILVHGVSQSMISDVTPQHSPKTTTARSHIKTG